MDGATQQLDVLKAAVTDLLSAHNAGQAQSALESLSTSIGSLPATCWLSVLAEEPPHCSAGVAASLLDELLIYAVYQLFVPSATPLPSALRIGDDLSIVRLEIPESSCDLRR